MKEKLIIIVISVVIVGCNQLRVPDPPTLYSPVDGEEVIHPNFVWEQTGGEYELQLSQDTAFATIVDAWQGIADTVFIPVDTLEPGIYYWRVRARVDEWSEWSTIDSFEVITVISPVELLSPSDADTVNNPSLCGVQRAVQLTTIFSSTRVSPRRAI